MKQKTIKLTMEYVGTNYCGWQLQPNGVSIQQILEERLAKITGREIRIHGAGRTDAGVHAEEQVAHLRVETRLEASDFKRALNSLLPDDIVIKDSVEESPEFHSQFSSKGKRYRYTILNRGYPSAFDYPFVWYLPYSLELNIMKEASEYLVGKHDFAAFMASKSHVTTAVRNLTTLDIVKQGDKILFFFEGDGFLRHMVRIIVGTLVDFGFGKRSPGEMKDILRSGNRRQAGRTARPGGLCLVKVFY